MHMIRTLLIAAAALVAVPVMVAAQSPNSLLDRWYTALFDVNRVALGDLLAEDAEIELADLGVVQTKAEFIAALDEWEQIAATADFAWQLDPETEADATSSTALVCYQFPDNELLVRETFIFKNAKVVRSLQTTVGDSCDEF